MAILLWLNLAVGFSAAQGTGEGDNLPRYWEIHAALLTVGTVLFVGAYVALWLKLLAKLEKYGIPVIAIRISRMWYKWHMYMGAIGVVLIDAGVIWGYIMVQLAHGGAHLRIPHAYVGFMAGFISVVPIISGLASRRARKRRPALRWWHVALGLSAIAVILVGIATGWALE